MRVVSTPPTPNPKSQLKLRLRAIPIRDSIAHLESPQSDLATQISGIVLPFISTTNNPAKYPGRMNLSASSNPGGKPSATP